MLFAKNIVKDDSEHVQRASLPTLESYDWKSGNTPDSIKVYGSHVIRDGTSKLDPSNFLRVLRLTASAYSF